MATPSERLRKAIILRTFNRRKGSDQTFYDQFYGISYKEKVDGKQYINFSDLKVYLDFRPSHPSVMELSRNGSNRIELDDFLYFLKYGQLKKLTIVSNKHISETSSHQSISDRYNTLSNHIHAFESVSNSFGTQTINASHSNDPHLTIVIDLKLGTTAEKVETKSDGANINKTIDNPKVSKNASSYSNDSGSSSLELIRSSNTSGSTSEGVKNVWKKSEIVKQERIISYITIDALGIKQVRDVFFPRLIKT